ncbi:glutathione ABC transporter substrate-binding protein [Halobacillus sp. BAB-2008]|uniref:glutathione ABC transporter substrate-binding protein n=1 Tax=Halobacillus sp. BAB-2008 TaxID=1246484 RepID=UPI0002A4EEBF|nr:glutathione ABC transporter substrate-binding protein [Halobacillus sp. BAB-2008]ELK48084.1 family 5 extracellular solute-binding protein [Halobacillus sp. BAB-2008]
MKLSRFLSVLSLLLVLVIAGCGNGEGDGNGTADSSKKAEAPSKEEGLTIAVDGNFTSMDPHDTNDNQSYSAQSAVYEGLLGFDEDLNIVPVLAESYEANENSTEFTFQLKEGITFHDGTPFNAEAVKANIDRLADPDSQLRRSSLFELVDSTEVLGEYEVKVTLKEPFGAMPNNFAHPAAAMISPESISESEEEIARNPVGTGPFQFKEWKSGDHLTVEKFDDYRDPEVPKVDQLVFKPVPESGSRSAMLQTGEADFVFPVSTSQVDTLENQAGVTVENKPSLVVKYFSMNTMKKPFDDPKVRQAINYAIDKEAYVNVIYDGYATVAESSIAPDTQHYSGQEVYEYDPEKAKELLAEAGYPDGFETTIWGGTSSDKTKMMQFYKQQLSQVGIKLNVVPMEGGTLGDNIWGVEKPEDTELELYNGGWSPSTADADWGLRPLFSSESFPPESYNTSYYKNDQVDELLQKALNTADDDKRAEYYAEAQEMIWNDAPWVFLAVPDLLYAHQDYVKGITMLSSGVLDLKNAEIVSE